MLFVSIITVKIFCMYSTCNCILFFDQSTHDGTFFWNMFEKTKDRKHIIQIGLFNTRRYTQKNLISRFIIILLTDIILSHNMKILTFFWFHVIIHCLVIIGILNLIFFILVFELIEIVPLALYFNQKNYERKKGNIKVKRE